MPVVDWRWLGDKRCEGVGSDVDSRTGTAIFEQTGGIRFEIRLEHLRAPLLRRSLGEPAKVVQEAPEPDWCAVVFISLGSQAESERVCLQEKSVPETSFCPSSLCEFGIARKALILRVEGGRSRVLLDVDGELAGLRDFILARAIGRKRD